MTNLRPGTGFLPPETGASETITACRDRNPAKRISCLGLALVCASVGTPWSIDTSKLRIPHNTFVLWVTGRHCRPNSRT